MFAVSTRSGENRNVAFASVVDAVEAIAAGRIVMVVDNEHRENEGDLIIAAEYATPEALAFFVRHTSGFICTAITSERADELRLPLMVPNNTERQKTAFTVTVDYKPGSRGRGGSAVQRARTARALVDTRSRPEDFDRPGHMHVLRAEPLGVLSRPGHTEAAVDLARLAGLSPAGVAAAARHRRRARNGHRSGAGGIRPEAWAPADQDRRSHSLPPQDGADRPASG